MSGYKLLAMVMGEMDLRVLIVVSTMLLSMGCGVDKHLPSSNPPEYDPKKVYTAPAALPSTSALATIPPDSGPPPIQFPPFEPAPNAKGEWKTAPVKPESLQLFKTVKSPCEALSKIIHGLGSAQLFAGTEGQALKQTLGAQAESVAQSLDQQLFHNLRSHLGLTEQACPAPVPARKSSLGGFLQTPRLLLVTGPAQRSFQLAQATRPGGAREGYTVREGSMKLEIPPDAVGMKSREWRIEEGHTPATAGDRKAFTLINGGYAKKCPTPDPAEEGAYVVEGEYEFSLVVDQTISYSNSVRTEYYAVGIQAKLKGRVGDDANLQYVDLDALLVAGRGGANMPTRFAHQRQHVRFVPSNGLPSHSNWSVSEWDAELGGMAPTSAMSMLVFAVTLMSGPIYMEAQMQWGTANTCVEIIFTPPPKTRKFVPNESTPVKVELRTKQGQRVVPAKFKEARERPAKGNGQVSPNEAESQQGAPAMFTYKAPEKHVKNSGFFVGAGVAEAKDGEWELAPSSYVLKFKSHIVQEPLNFIADPKFGMQLSSNGFDAQVEATVPLRRRDDGEWAGEGRMQYTTRTLTQPAQCEIRIQGTGTTTFHVNGGSISNDPEPFAVKLIILPGQTEEVAETHCTSGNTPEKLKELFASQGVQGGEAHVASKGGGWRAAFNLTRFRSFIWTHGRQGYEMGGWTQVLNSDVVATKTMRMNCGIGLTACREETTLTLRLTDEADAGASLPK